MFYFIYFSKQTVNLQQKILTYLFIVVFVLFVYCFCFVSLLVCFCLFYVYIYIINRFAAYGSTTHHHHHLHPHPTPPPCSVIRYPLTWLISCCYYNIHFQNTNFCVDLNRSNLLRVLNMVNLRKWIFQAAIRTHLSKGLICFRRHELGFCPNELEYTLLKLKCM